jgi:hypothetical protein
MKSARRLVVLAGAVVLGCAALLGWIRARPAVSPAAATQLAQATAYFDSVIAVARTSVPRGPRGDELSVALGYLERLRLGLGSPFRLVDDASSDPRLTPAMQSRVAWALLARLRRGDAYAIDPSVLDGLGPWGNDGDEATGRAHLALIEHTIATARDPRAGELTVRLAYLVASARGTVTPASVDIATQVAALVRDRVAAMNDLRDLLAAASADHDDVLDLLHVRRAARAFDVERPPLAPLPEAAQIEAMDHVPRMLAALDTLDRDSLAATGVPARDASSVLNVHFAKRLRDLGAAGPPLAQVVVAMRSHPLAALDASNEETLTGAYLAPEELPDSTRRARSLAVLASAVGVRSLAQDTPWFPGDPGPSPADLETQFGLADVSFARAVPESWRPYYLRELDSALTDMRRALPGLSLSGLHVRFGDEPLPDSALAMHDPRTRTLELSIASSGGTIAHEVAHDLDWQTARRLFASGGYSTDHAARESRGPLASSVRGLAEARVLRPYVAAGSAPPVDRPAELFARGTDWFVASTLAWYGRSDGFLSAIQDGVLAGYAAGAPAAVGTAGAASLLGAIEQMTYLPDSARLSFESQWADPRLADPTLLVRRVLELPVPWRALRRGAGASTLLDAPLSAFCESRVPALSAREHLLTLAADARARGVITRRARYARPGTEWAQSVLGTAPWSTDAGDQMVARLRGAMLAELASSFGDQGLVPAAPAIFRSSAASCSTSSR